MGQPNISFRPVQGLESQIMKAGYNEGWVYFATDSKKIYLDANGESKLPMGGNSGIYYGQMEMTETPPENQTEFEFSIYDIQGNDETDRIVIPNINDLILNIPDGCFYRVINLDGEGVDTVIITNKLTVAGSGGSESGPSEDVGSYKLTAITPKAITLLEDQEYSIGFKAEAIDSSGAETGNGTYTLMIGGVQKTSGTAYQGENYIPINKYLTLGENKIRLIVYMDIGGSDLISKSLSYTITTTSMNLEWNYDVTQINSTLNDFKIKYSVSGVNINKTVNLIIDDLYSLDLKKDFTSTSEQVFTLTVQDLVKYNLIHGAHKFKLQASTMLNGKPAYATPIEQSVIFADPANSTPIISHRLFNKNLTQYNTTFIPILIYSSDNVSGTATVTLREEGIEVDKWENVPNATEMLWSYTPLLSGTRLLTIQCGVSEVSFTVEVEALGISTEEVSDYAYKFKASDFASNAAVQSWNSNGITATFSDEFDWINGGLKSEKDESGNNRQYVCIKAGSQMIINHKLFANNAKRGKNLKVIFQAANCRDYDAKVLECKQNTKIINVDSIEDHYLSFVAGETIRVGESISINESGVYNLINPIESILDPNNIESRSILKEKFIEHFELVNLNETNFIANKYFVLIDGEYIVASEFNNLLDYFEQKIYQVKFGEIENEEENDNNKEYYVYYYRATIEDSFEGFVMNAQYATLNSKSSTLTTQYCEDTYIELEFDIAPQESNNLVNPKNYIKYWIDGVPSGYVIYSNDDSFMTAADQKIIIGSPDCDVYLYMIKLYEDSLSNDEHLSNFIMDAPNAIEMLNRFKRNDIMDDNRPNEISPTKLSLANPDCLVHVYTLTEEGMPITKKTKRYGCKYHQYHNSDTAVLTADDVMIKVQGTSSEKYVVSAANIDAEFTTGFTDVVTNTHLDGWSMDGGKAIPVDFFCTKVNVASCENANNALNQEWYNMFQPYQTVVKCKRAGARDTMQFTNGVMFIVDNNKTYKTGENDDKKLNNVFGEISSNGIKYIDNPYAKMYSIANMGNSKDNIEVFHDNTNPLECCIEVSDNQTVQQWMVSDNYNKDDIGEGEKYFEFRYPDGVDEVKKLGANGQKMIDGWNNFVSWMAESNPQPKYEKYIATNEEEYLSFSFNHKTQKNIPTYQFENKIDYILTGYDENISEYYIETPHTKGYTNQPLEQTVHFDPYTFKGYRCTEQFDEKGQLWQKNYTPLIAGLTVNTYAGDYTHDTYEYRMAKMLSECEDHLVMDSVVFHYLFIERHTMIDNVAKNTFWSTEDCVHWNLTKDYDNDTADGNDNNGKFTRTYGMEVMDKLNASTYVFNAHQSVWLNFIHGLPTVREYMYQQIDNKTVNYNGRILKCWNANDYLWLFKQWQSRIPERCWIEDYYRKYFRPYELYNDTMFNSMMEGGQKTHQRKQYEIYQNTYMSSEYSGSDTQSSYLTIRSNGKGMKDAPLAVEVYSDCYIRMDTGSDTSIQRVKRNERNYFKCPTDNLNNATMYFYPAKVFSVIGSTVPGEGMVGDFYPEQLSFSNAGKLRELVVSTYENGDTNESLKQGFDLLNNSMLEVLYAANLNSYEGGLNLTNSKNLREVDARGSSFGAIEFADNAPIRIIKLNNPSSLSLSNTKYLENLSIANFGRLSVLKLHNVDNNNISTLDLVNNAYALTNYRLTNVNWNLNSASSIDENKINVLEKLLSKKPIDDPQSPSGYEPLQNALTGSLTIESNAYNGNNSFDIYNKYAQDEVYPNLDIVFMGDNAKLYSVEIYDGDNSVCWNRKIIPGNNVDQEFLSDGPRGAFSIEQIYKSSTPSHIYTFSGEWNVFKKTDLNTVIYTIPESNDLMPYFNNVEYDIVIIPKFDQQDRYYELSFYGVDQTVPFEKKSYKYGSTWDEVQPSAIPYKEPPAGLYEAWDFKGYSLVSNSTTIVPTGYEVTNNQSFYAVFELVNDIRTVVHEEWFEFSNYEYTYDSIYPDFAPLPLVNKINGYKIKPKVSLRGKITIPSMYNNKPVLALANHFATSLDNNITHVFCEKDSNLLVIEGNAFEKTNLQYFDFSQDTVRYIGAQAFLLSHLDANLLKLSKNLFFVGEEAFQAGIRSQSKVTIKIPGNVALVYTRGFNNPQVGQGSTWEIGEEDCYSRLKLDWPGLSTDYINKFTADDGKFPNVIFRTARYQDWDEYLDINQTYQVYRAFVRPNQNVNNFNLTLIPQGV